MTAVPGEYMAASLCNYIVGYVDLWQLSAYDPRIEKNDKA